VLSDYLAAKLLEASVADSSFASGDPLYLALLSAPGTRSDTGTTLATKEVDYGGYGRVAVAASVWGEASGPAITNAEPIALAKRTSGQAQVVGWALCDAVTKGNVHHIGVTAAFVVDEADPEPEIGVGLLRVVFA
jgi:hypothetical protein